MQKEKKEVHIEAGLKRLPRDKRDFQYSKVFGTIEELPTEDFLVGDPLEIKDQFDTDMCTAFAACAVSELQEGIKLSPEFQFAKIKELEGQWDTWGADLRQVCRSLVKKGSLRKEDCPFELGYD